jgi:PAS domain S-box-containing protein
MSKRKRSADSVRRRLEFEAFLFDLSSTFIGLPEEKVDVNMDRGLARVGEFLKMDRVTLLELSSDRAEMTVVYSWNSRGVPPAAPVLTKDMQPWWMKQILRGDMSLASRVDDLPATASAEKAYLRQRGVASAASIPLRVGGEIAGAISFVTVHRHVAWTERRVKQLKAIGDILWNALKRRQAMQALLAAQSLVRESEERFRLAMQNVAEGVYTLDLQGLVTYMNPAAEAMFGWTMAELLGKKMHDVTHYQHADGRAFPGSDCPGLQVLKNGIELREQADTFIRKDGRFFPVVYSASPLEKDGIMAGIVVGFRDDTLDREAERMMRESEERFRLIASTAPVIIWMSGADKRCTFVNESWANATGLPPESALGDGWAANIHPEDVEHSLNTYRSAFDRREPFQMEYRLRRHDGELRWIFARGVPRYDAAHSFVGYIGSAIDVTERREAEEVLSTLSRRLMEAQELERTRLARELHDDINQRMALLLLSLETVRQRLPAKSRDLRQELAKAIDTATNVTRDVQDLSHRLHSSKLHILGLETAARDVCREVSDRSDVDIRFHTEGVMPGLPEDLSICLYRVLQEALQNAIKHSHSQQIDVSLQHDLSGVTLTVRDSGIGFEPTKALRGQGLGLIGMKERLKLVDGELTIDTSPAGGATICARVPLDPGLERAGRVQRSSYSV